MYNINDILGEINNFMANCKSEAAQMSKDCQRVLGMYNNNDIDGACKQVFNWVNVFKGSKTKVSEYSTWFRKIVYNLIYQHLDQGAGAKYNQTELLEKMDLPKDVFKAKYWNMYSPDMKIRQSRYECFSLPLNYAEVECNDIYRAMVHYIICHADILTDTVVDLFGKMGLVPALCANGYSCRHVFSEEEKYKELLLFQRALKKPAKLYKLVKEMQQYLSKRSYKRQIKLISKWIKISQLHTMLAIKGLTVEQAINGDFVIWEDKNEIYSWAADYFFRMCFTPEYWLDSKRLVSKARGKRVITTWLDTSKVSHKQIDKFTGMKKEDFLKFADLYVNKVELVNADAKECIYDMQEESLHGGLNNYRGTKDLLYIDVPKYIREEKRFLFNDKDHMALLDMLMDYEGNWILVWKMYIEKPADATVKKNKQSEVALEDRPYEDIYNKNFFRGEKEYEQIKYERTIELRELVKVLCVISSESRQLKVFRYRDKNKNTPKQGFVK